MSNQVMVLFIQIFGALSTTSKVPSWFIILEKKLTPLQLISPKLKDSQQNHLHG